MNQTTDPEMSKEHLEMIKALNALFLAVEPVVVSIVRTHIADYLDSIGADARGVRVKP